MAKTLEVFENISVLTENLIQSLVDCVYSDGYSTKEQKEFDEVDKYFKRFLDDLMPFEDNSDIREDFYGLFNSVEVIPERYRTEYEKNIEEKRYYDALGYVVNISNRRFAMLAKENRIDRASDGIPVILCIYDDELGLLVDEKTDNFL